MTITTKLDESMTILEENFHVFKSGTKKFRKYVTYPIYLS